MVRIASGISASQDQSLKEAELASTTMCTPPKATELGRGLKLTDKQLLYLAHMKICVPSVKLIREAFHKEFGRTISVNYVCYMSHFKKSRAILEKVKEQYEKSIGFEFFALKLSRMRALTDLYYLAK